MSKMPSLLCLILVTFVSHSMAKLNLSTINFSTIIEYTSIPIQREPVETNKREYERISLEGFGNTTRSGHPSLPVYNYLMAIPKAANLSITYEENQRDTVACKRLLPASVMKTDDDSRPSSYHEERNCYEQNNFYPSSPIEVVERFTLFGVEIAKVQFCPVQYNPVTNQLIHHKSIKAEVSFTGADINRSAPIFGEKAKIITNLVENGEDFVRNFSTNDERILREEKNILIITHEDFKPAADSLAVWQRMKGYDVTIVSDTSWVVTDKNRPKAMVKEKTDIVDKIVKNYFISHGNSGYLLIMGGWWFVPNQLLFSSVWTDQHYSAMGSNKLFGDIPRGRIACETLDEAMRSVRKIIQYESVPSMDPDFYNSFLMASMFEGSHDNGYSEKRFAKTAEELFQYLTNKQNYSGGDRVYNYNFTPTAELHPTNWNNGTYANGEPLPSHLQWPTFPWDGTKGDVSASLNKGKFMALYRGHGQPTNWSAFKFHIDDIKKLTNKGKYPIVFSITCNTGKFDRNIYNPAWDLVCFTQEFLQAENSGAAGVLGAAQSSFSGPNDALAHAIVDAIWPTPGTSCVNPFKGLRDNSYREPIYPLGDIMLYGLGRMAADWNTGDLPMQKNLVMYHYFGDPTTKIITQVPKILKATSTDKIASNSNSFTVSNITSNSGIATLVNKTTGELIGRAIIKGPTVTIPIYGSFKNSDVIALTITADHYKPFIKNLNGTVSTLKNQTTKVELSLLFKSTNIHITIPSGRIGELSIFDSRGRRVSHTKVTGTGVVQQISLHELHLGTGIYLIQLHSDDKTITEKINFI